MPEDDAPIDRMTETAEKIRLFVETPLTAGASVGLDRARSHYLAHVMRLGPGDTVALFNGADGEWRARIDGLARGWCSLAVEERLRAQDPSPDLWLVFAPIKRARIDYVAAKATELGVLALVPAITRRTAISRVNVERLRANAIEAAEQCERLDVPEVREPASLDAILAGWPADRRLLMCDESGDAPPIGETLARLAAQGAGAAPWAVLIGPEGGFDPSELDALDKLTFVSRVGMGPRILRAETAAVAALSCWQALIGDWRSRTNTRTGETERRV